MCGCGRGRAGGGTRDVTRDVDAGGGTRAATATPVMTVPAVGGGAAAGPTRKRKPIVPLQAMVSLTIVDTAIWGPPMWRLMHYHSIRGPMTTLLTALQDGIPCPECTGHYRAWFATHPVSGADVVEWVLALHNDVTARRTGGGAAWTTAQVQAEYGPGGVYTATAAAADLVTLQPLMGSGVIAALVVLAAEP